VTVAQAKEILTLYRPWADANDPTYAEARRLAGQDAELRRWFDAHCSAQMAIRDRFRTIPVPEGLKEQIVSERAAWTKPVWLRRPALLAAAAAMALCVSLAAIWWSVRSASMPPGQVNLAGFRGRMVTSALRMYKMDLETNDAVQIRAYLAQHNAYSAYALTPALAGTTQTGCGVLTWQGGSVSMVCFHSGQPLPAGAKSDLYLFVVDRAAVPDAPTDNQPRIEKVSRVYTASWSAGNKVYVLAAEGGEEFLKRFL